MSYTKKHSETLCWSCKKACGRHPCTWSTDFSPISGWEATPTTIRNISENGVPEIAKSFKVESCPEYIQTTDYYVQLADIYRIISQRTGYKEYNIRQNSEESLSAFKEYSKRYPRSMEVSEEERNRYLKELYENKLKIKKNMKEKEKKLKKYQKLLDNH